MKIAVLGMRGFPKVQGGVETHCEKLYLQLAKFGCEIKVFTRSPYVDPKIKVYKGVDLIPINCPKRKSFEAIGHSFFGVFAAKKIDPDILHIHAIGPSLTIPLARALGMKVVMTNHGPDYERKKWGRFAKFILKLGENLGSRWANAIICISKTIADNIRRKYNKIATVIPNGVIMPEIMQSTNILKKYGLEKGKYILSVGRFVPEKGFHDLIEAFNQFPIANCQLVIVGRADHPDRYSLNLEKKASKNNNIILTGFLTGKSLQELYSHAGLFVLPSYHEGLPIVLLEAMSYGLSCIASNIPANRNVELPRERFFTTGNVREIAKKIKEFVDKPLTDEEKRNQLNVILERYNWEKIAEKTLEVYQIVAYGS